MSVRAVAAGAAVAALAGLGLAPRDVARAAPAGAVAVPATPAAAALAGSLLARLGRSAAGSYVDERTGRLVVNVFGTDAGAVGAAEEAVRAAGAQPRRVRLSQARLDEARQTLDERAAIPGTAWVTDPRANRVVVTADPTVTGAKLAQLNRVTSGLGEAVEVRRASTVLRRFLAGGDAIWGSSARCSLGFNVTKAAANTGGKGSPKDAPKGGAAPKGGKGGGGTAGQPQGAYFVTAGHCGKAEQSWSATRGGPQIGTTTSATFPGHDYALVQYTADVPHPSAVTTGGGTQPIARAGQAAVGQAVSRSGSTTGVHTGTVTGLNATVNYQEGRVTGLIETNVCAEPGDSGGPLYAGDTGLGLTSGGSGDCTLGGKTYFQPLPEVLQAYGVRVG
ncbi:S1 family peptidase [Streptomyces mashuensis]|uniref:S1 family peptidase n=1 Tax=Streptomyces mashuensis TaxID=33904 RepID=UPI001E539B54|nr:S1 family peptidase [Streptomyces mashuensis]